MKEPVKLLSLPLPSPEGEGRSLFPPGNMVKLYLYGYRNKSRSSQKLQNACRINTGTGWLMEGL